MSGECAGGGRPLRVGLRPAAWPLLVLWTGCAAGPDVLELVVRTDPATLHFERVRIEVAVSDGTGIWERSLEGAGTVALAPGGAWSGSLRVWGVVGPADEPTVVAFGETTTAEARRAEVTLRPAGDSDRDWVPDETDNCPDVRNPLQLQSDGDPPGDACDVCPEADDPDQRDTDGDGLGDACDPAVCGDGVREPGEACDDGNADRGDGCSPGCQVERCGNGVIDPGEACDDGNEEDGDGCSSACVHAPASVDLPGAVDAATVRGAELPDGSLLLSGVVTDGAVPPGGRIFLARADGTAGLAGPERGEWRDASPQPVLLVPGVVDGAFGVVWEAACDACGEPPGPGRRLRAGIASYDLSSVEPAEDLAAFGTGALDVRGTWGGTPAGAVAFFFGAGAPTTGLWLGSEGWPPPVVEDVSAWPVVELTHMGVARRGDAGWVVVWDGLPAARPGSTTSLWARRFDGTRTPVDPEELLVERDALWDDLAVLHEPHDDVYLIADWRTGEATTWRRLPPAGGAAEGPFRGAALHLPTALLAVGDGTLLATWFEVSGAGECVVHGRLLDGYGTALGPDKATVVAGDRRLGLCDGSVAGLADGRVLVAWGQGLDEGAGWTYALGWWLAPSPVVLAE